MATFASGISNRVAYITEVTPGTTPATPTFSVIPYTQFNISGQRDTFSDPSIVSDTQNHYLTYGNNKVSGDVDSILLAQTATSGNMLYDPFWESLLESSWTTNVLKIGTTHKSFTFETTSTDTGLAASIYSRYTGCEITSAQLTLNMQGPATVKWGVIGMGFAEATSAIASSTYTAIPSTSQPLVHGNSSGFIKEGGSTIAIITSISLNINKAADANYSLGSYTAQNITSSKKKITGTVTAYFTDLTLLNKFINGTSTSIDIKMSDGTRSLQILLPNVYYTAGNHPITNDNPIVLNMPFEAIYDGTNSSAIVLTRS